VFQVQRYVHGTTEFLYLLTFCLPRFLDQDMVITTPTAASSAGDCRLPPRRADRTHLTGAAPSRRTTAPWRCASWAKFKRQNACSAGSGRPARYARASAASVRRKRVFDCAMQCTGRRGGAGRVEGGADVVKLVKQVMSLASNPGRGNGAGKKSAGRETRLFRAHSAWTWNTVPRRCRVSSPRGKRKGVTRACRPKTPPLRAWVTPISNRLTSMDAARRALDEVGAKPPHVAAEVEGLALRARRQPSGGVLTWQRRGKAFAARMARTGSGLAASSNDTPAAVVRPTGVGAA